MIPEPPAEPLPLALLWTATVGGIAGRCVMCHQGSCTWLDLTECGLAPVIDNIGTLTDHTPLHRRCTPALAEYWASLGNHSGPGESTDLPQAGGETSDRADTEVAPADVLAGTAPQPPAPAPVAPPPVGAYA